MRLTVTATLAFSAWLSTAAVRPLLAQESGDPLASVPPVDPDDPVLGPMLTPAFIEEVNRRWRGPGIGWDNGLWGSRFATGLKLDIPFGARLGQFFGIRLRGLFVQGHTNDSYDPLINAGGELFGRGPVILGIVRIYGGAGVLYGSRPSGAGPGARHGISPGGHLGLEFYFTSRTSAQLEVGGQGGAHPLGYDEGPSIMAGVMVYLGD